MINVNFNVIEQTFVPWRGCLFFGWPQSSQSPVLLPITQSVTKLGQSDSSISYASTNFKLTCSDEDLQSEMTRKFNNWSGGSAPIWSSLPPTYHIDRRSFAVGCKLNWKSAETSQSGRQLMWVSRLFGSYLCVSSFRTRKLIADELSYEYCTLYYHHQHHHHSS